MQLNLSARSALASVGLVGLGMLASPWHTAPQDPNRNVLARLAAQDAKITTLQARLAAHDAVLTPDNGVKLMKLLPHISIVEEENVDGTAATTMLFTGVNVQIVNGLGATNGNPGSPGAIVPGQTTVNALGNLIVGYNEGGDGHVRSGSHNIIVGIQHQYSSFGGSVGGISNTVSGAYASVSAGSLNTANGTFSSVGGGHSNTASGGRASVSGGIGNTASGEVSSVSGGVSNQAIGNNSSVSGGSENTASGYNSSISGGVSNQATSNNSSVSGGSDNTASGIWSSVSGGIGNTASGRRSSVSGGQNNQVTAAGTNGTVSGGCSVTVSTPCGHQ